MLLRNVLLAVPLLLGLLPSGQAQETKVDFQRDIRPILSNRCFKCHGPAAQEGGLRLDERERAVRRAIVPGKAAKSRLVHRILAPDDDEERMPPREAGDRLTSAQAALLKKWIDQGAEYTPHYAFRRTERPALPAVKDTAWPLNPVDRFVLARLEKEGIQPAPQAEAATLLRRVSLDLTGLLPSPAETDAFLQAWKKDPHRAYDDLVDRLLDSPHYAERMARHWLDLARYADSNGYTIDGKRSIWPWRDWVIDAFRRDLPFDRFTIEQLAGDLLPDADRGQQVATGFHRNTSFNEEGGTNPEQFRVERTIDRTNTTGTVWLGLTVGCAQCHTHKYDPISQKEYYQLYAFFNSVDEPKVGLPTAAQKQQLAALQKELAAARKEAQPKKKTPAELEKVLASLEEETAGGWQVVYPKMVTSEQGAVLSALEDRSVLASGKVGESDAYTVQSVAPSTGVVTAVRLEALTHDSLPKKGPGRAGNGNFVLSHLVFETDGTPHPFKRARADHSQKGYDVAEALKGDLSAGWAINSPNPREMNVPREAIFFLAKPHEVREGQAFVFTLKFSQMPKGYSLGRFRLSVTFASERVLDLPFEAQNIVFMDRKTRTPQDMTRLQQSLLKAPPASSRLTEIQKRIKAIENQVDSTLILRESARPRPTHVQKRGDFLDLGEAVQPNVFACLPPLTVKGRTPNRLDLAKWLVSRDNPLTARVVVNRVWQRLFGKGLVETENDFGMQGALPTHPDLLDWLAVEFMEPSLPELKEAGGPWSMKRLHKLIVTSAVYMQSSRTRNDLLEKDPQNRLLARQNRIRLDAEIIRDAALSASGLLNPKIGGPGVYPPQPPEIFAFTQNRHPWPESKGPDRYRRGMYTFIWRQSQHPLLTTFDAPDAQTPCTKRNRSNTPLQSLHLANDPTFVEFAQGLARRILKEAPREDEARVDYAFRLCFSRAAGPAERSRLLEFLTRQNAADAERTWTLAARVLLNLDEFITRE